MSDKLRETIKKTIRKVTTRKEHTYQDLEDALTEALARVPVKK